MRLLLGLLKKQTGIIEILGIPFEKNRLQILRNTGSLIESPSFYGHLSAIENLRIFSTIYSSRMKRAEQVLNMVGLSYKSKKATSHYSLGMKQRLGLAIALLPRPALLVLDEPTNGLDPNGMVEIRELLLELNQREGTSIFVSSHLLSEIEKLANHIGIINKGKLLFEGTLQTLSQHHPAQNKTKFQTNDIEKTLKIFQSQSVKTKVEEGVIVAWNTSEIQNASLVEQLIHNNVRVYEVVKEKINLEKIFLDLINE